jgi:TRAP-type C4-dicarboxylate transport system substrate-binding protein
MKKTAIFFPLLVFILMAGMLSAQTIKLGSLVPYGSPWEEELQRLRLEWAKISNNRIKLKIFPGGIAGGEEDMLRKMRFGQLQAAALTGPGLADVFGGVLALQIPLLVRTEEELDHLLETMGPTFEAEMEKNGFKLLFWNMVGWAHIFSRKPIVYPDDMRRQKMWVMAGNDEEAAAWKKMGFQVFVFPAQDVTVQLQNGGLDSFVTSPLVTVSSQWYEQAKYMAEFKFAPFVGGVIVPTSIWNRIPKALRSDLEAAAAVTSERMRAITNTANAEAVSAMEKQGLVVHPTPADAIAEWQEVVARGLTEFVGGKFDVKYYEEAKRILEEFRQEHGR